MNWGMLEGRVFVKVSFGLVGLLRLFWNELWSAFGERGLKGESLNILRENGQGQNLQNLL